MGASAVYTVECHIDPIALHSFTQSSFPDACCMPGSHLRVGAGETTRMNLREQHYNKVCSQGVCAGPGSSAPATLSLDMQP